MDTGNDSALIRARVSARLAAGCDARVFSIDIQGKRVWVKQTEAVRVTVWHKLMTVGYRLLRHPLLVPTVSDGGPEGLEAECRRLEKLASCSVPVPHVLATGDGWIALEDVGEALENVLRDPATRPDMAAQILAHASAALAKLHCNGRWHGKPTLKDIAWNPQHGIYFLDFEEDLASAYSARQERYLRDFLLYLYSLHRVLGENPDLIHSAVDSYREAAPPAVVRAAAGMGRQLYLLAMPMKLLHPVLGRDARAIMACLDTLRNLPR